MFTRQSTAKYGLLQRMSIKSTLTTEVMKAARMLLGWSQDDLAQKSGVSSSRLRHLEAKPGPLGGRASTIAAIRKAFEDAGIEFSNGDSPGIKLHKIWDENGMRRRRFSAVSALRPSRPVKAVKKTRAKKVGARPSKKLK
jgi:transcriptional regulator with XRE-family HTH domain